MKISKEFMLRDIAGDYVVVPTGQSVFKFMGLITVNEVGAFLWKCLQAADCKQEDLVQQLCEEYEVNEENARKDVSEFIEALNSRHIITEIE